MSHHIIFDCELIGTQNPRFLVCTECVETGEKHAFWFHKRGHMDALWKLLQYDTLTWVSFNGIKFDEVLISGVMWGMEPLELKQLAHKLIHERLAPFQVYKRGAHERIPIDHIDLIETAPGVMISLKTYSGRLHCKSIVDMPFHHDQDLTPRQLKIVEEYCFNDIAATKALFLDPYMQDAIALREQMSKEYGIDLRSKSDAQMAEHVFKTILNLKSGKASPPISVGYLPPEFIQPKNPKLLELIEKIENEEFEINQGNGSVIAPKWMGEPFELRGGLYQLGVGGLHSQHDVKLYVEASNEVLLSDFDVASYYPNLIMKCGFVPRMSGNKGEHFIHEYSDIYRRRLEAKRAGNKAVDKSLKTFLNGSFGKLGSIYSALYAPDLLLGVTVTGQLNLLCLIDELASIRGVEVLSANTDGILVKFTPTTREKVLKVFARNSRKTGFEYEETPYAKIAMKDVNNYIAIPLDPTKEPKRKGLYAKAGVKEMKNPTMEVCSEAAARFLKDGTDPAKFIRAHKDIRDFVSIRSAKGGAQLVLKTKEVNDWIPYDGNTWIRQAWLDGELEKHKPVKGRTKKNLPPEPVEVIVKAQPIGRTVRWYMSTDKNLPPIKTILNNTRVAKTEGGKLCMTLPDMLPKDLDFDWYINETRSMLADMGVVV